jgi:hypothetical protein
MNDPHTETHRPVWHDLCREAGLMLSRCHMKVNWRAASSETCASVDSVTYRPANRNLCPAMYLLRDEILVGTAASVCWDIPAWDRREVQ